MSCVKDEELDAAADESYELFAVTIREGGVQAVYARIKSKNIDELFEELTAMATTDKAIQFENEDGTQALLMVGPGMEIRVWPQAKYDENEARMRELRAATAARGPSPGVVMMPPGFDPRRMG